MAEVKLLPPRVWDVEVESARTTAVAVINYREIDDSKKRAVEVRAFPGPQMRGTGGTHFRCQFAFWDPSPRPIHGSKGAVSRKKIDKKR